MRRHPLLLAAILAAPACDRTYGTSLPGDPGDAFVEAGAPPDLALGAHPMSLSIPVDYRDQLDVLFLIDNSIGMEAMQQALTNQLSLFLEGASDLADQGSYVDLHLGVVTSDFGAGATGAPGCTPSSLDGGGDRGRLQAVGRKAPPGCMPPKGANFIQYKYGPNGPSASNLPGSQGLQQTFACMSAVGTSGCGFEHQLESVFAALRNNYPENAGFLRDRAALAVVLLTNEDDASAPPDTDVFDQRKSGQYGYEHSYSRQTRFGVMCGGKLPPYGPSGGPLASCVPAPNPSGAGPGKLYDVSRYIEFFTRPKLEGGVKEDPRDVALIAIDAPEAPFEVILAHWAPVVGQPYEGCGAINERSNPPCVPVLQHSCRDESGLLFGDPAVRINAVVRAASTHAIGSICEADYTPPLSAAFDTLAWNQGVGCLPRKLPADGSGGLLVRCAVTEVQDRAGVMTKTQLPECQSDHGNAPCWEVRTPTDACRSRSPDAAAMTLDWGGQPPSRATIEAICQAE